MSVRITSVFAQLHCLQDAPDVQFTTVELGVIGYRIGHIRAKFTEVWAVVIGVLPKPDIIATQIYMNVVSSFTPLYEFIPVIVSDVFPNDISYNSVGSTRFATDVIVVDSGDDQRISRWDQPLMEYDVAYGVRTMEQLHALIAFFRAMKGRKFAFNYQDNVDFASTLAVLSEARTAPPIGPFDQFIGTGDDSTYIWQLTKTYATASESNIRPITRPQPGTTRMSLGGFETFDFTVDTNTGLVQFASPEVAVCQGVASKTSRASDVAPNVVITGIAGDFLRLQPYINRKAVTQGWTNPLNNTDETMDLFIQAVSTDGSTVTVAYPHGHGHEVETNVAGVIVYIHPAPIEGITIGAGFLFYVPVRFDTDTLPVTIEDYGVGGANSIKLIEVRASDPN